MTQGGYYKIAIDDDSVSKEEYEKLNEKYLKLLSKCENIQKILG